MELQLQITNIHHQLAQIIQLVSKPPDYAHTLQSITPAPTSPPRIGNKRPNVNRTPEKLSYKEASKEDEDQVTSATSDLDEGMEGCEG